MEDLRIFTAGRITPFDIQWWGAPLAGQEFCIEESCDGYFYTYLTAAELRQLGEELIALADGKE